MHNNCNDDFERIKKRIAEEQKKYKCCYLRGPQGPRGEQGIQGEQGIRGEPGPQGERGSQGPATIKIGNTFTLDEGLDAKVSNVGTEEDVILNFEIPKGSKGDKGEQGEKGDVGPRGLPGEIGRAEHISIDETETLEPGEDAQVMDTFEGLVHHLSFFIPKGDKGDSGPRGPQGPAGTSFVSAYGMRYSLANTQIDLPQDVDTVIPLPETGAAFFTEYPDGNSIKIKESGFYLVSYLLCGATNEECVLTMAVKANDLLQPATNTTSEFSAHMVNCISGSTIIALQPNDLVTLSVKASKVVNIKFSGTTNAMLSVVKIH